MRLAGSGIVEECHGRVDKPSDDSKMGGTPEASRSQVTNRASPEEALTKGMIGNWTAGQAGVPILCLSAKCGLLGAWMGAAGAGRASATRDAQGGGSAIDGWMKNGENEGNDAHQRGK